MNGAIGLPDINEISNDAWKKLSTKRIYFAHQSVGDNIIQGISDIVIENYAIELTIKKRAIDEESGAPVFMHSKIGENGHPIKKIDDFKNVIQDEVGKNIDIAVLKLCFWDIRKDTDINEVFNKYKCNIGELKKEYPHIQFIHCTVPLMKHTNTLIAKIKRLLNISIFADLDNIKRNEFNELILKEYRGKESLFDIAMIESTLSDGTRTYFKQGENKYFCLAPGYTNDGGHLNPRSRRFVAEQLLITLTNTGSI